MEYIPAEKPLILVVDDDPGLLTSIRATLASAGLPEPALLANGRKTLEWIRRHQCPLVVLDLLMPHIHGLEILPALKAEFPATEVVILTAVDDVVMAVEAMKYGAYDYLVKPVPREKLLIVIERALERYNLRHGLEIFDGEWIFADLKHPEAFTSMVAQDKAMARVFHQAESFAPTDYNLLITGESGTGKELLARVIHSLSRRSTGPFMAVNMAAFIQHLFDDEFFGHTRGAFTGAVVEKMGFFEAAAGGTLFLDEITELPPELQAKLLRVIQEKELFRLGSTKPRQVDVRIIAASNRDVRQEVARGKFRNDLYFRLNTCHIHIPPLRERKGDILPLAQGFLKKHRGETGKTHTLGPDLIEWLFTYPFPGNVRELENLIASAIFLEKGEVLRVSSLGLGDQKDERTPPGQMGDLLLETVEKEHIFKVLGLVEGNRTQAARLLGIGLRTLQRKLKMYGE